MLSLKEVQDLEFQILLEIRDVCEKYSLKYSLYAGTMLGAIRHKDFIPWDDDVDILMPKNDYDKFIKIVKENKIFSKHLKVKFPGDNNYPYPYIKIVDTRTEVNDNFEDKFKMGLWVDIFPMDYVYDDPKKNASIVKKVTRYQYWIFRLTTKIDNFKGIKKIILSCVRKMLNIFNIDYKYFVKKLLSYRNLPKSKTLGEIIWVINDREIGPVDWFENYIECDFRNEKFKIIKDYDKFLKKEYGDYMKLPPLEERNGHCIKAYFKDNDKYGK